MIKVKMTDAKNNSQFGLIFIEYTGREKFKHIKITRTVVTSIYLISIDRRR